MRQRIAVAAAKLELSARNFHPSDYAPLGIMVVIVLALFIGVLDNFLGPIYAHYAHLGVR